MCRENKYLYWNVFPDEEKHSKFLYYLSTEENVPTSFKNLYYDFSYDKYDEEQYEDQLRCKNKNSLKNMDLNSEKQGVSDLHSFSRRNVRGNTTRNFLVYVPRYTTILVLDRCDLIQVPKIVPTQ